MDSNTSQQGCYHVCSLLVALTGRIACLHEWRLGTPRSAESTHRSVQFATNVSKRQSGLESLSKINVKERGKKSESGGVEQ